MPMLRRQLVSRPYRLSRRPEPPNTTRPTHWPTSEQSMSKTERRPRPSLLLLLLACVTAISSCATDGQAVKPSVCPKPLPAPSNVMRQPSAERSLRAELFESAETPTTSSVPAKPL